MQLEDTDDAHQDTISAGSSILRSSSWFKRGLEKVVQWAESVCSNPVWIAVGTSVVVVLLAVGKRNGTVSTSDGIEQLQR